MNQESVSSIGVVAPALSDGVLNVSKPSGWTSHDVVDQIRRTLGLRKVGHAGTLDPLATGVLPVLLGKGTRVSEYLVEWEKEYEAILRLGQDTDTQDATGVVIREQPVKGITDQAVRDVAAQFLGTQEQVPPMYSALKVEGRPLYKMARTGKTVHRASRSITIFRLEVLKTEIPDVSIRVVCSKGTYIRTLGADLGKALGVGGHVRQLCRTRVGPFHIQDAISPIEIDSERWLREHHQKVWNLDAVLEHVPEVVIPSSMVSRALNGAPIPQSEASHVDQESPGREFSQEIVRVKDPMGQLLGLGKFAACSSRSAEGEPPLRLVKVFGH